MKHQSAQHIALSLAISAPLFALTACQQGEDAETGVSQTMTTVHGAGGSFADDQAQTDTTSEAPAPAENEEEEPVDGGWGEDIPVPEVGSVGYDTPLDAYSAYMQAVSTWQDGDVCAMTTPLFAHEMVEESGAEYVAMEKDGSSAATSCVEAVNATLAWYDLDVVRDQAAVYEVVGADEDFQSTLDHATETHNSIKIGASDVDLAGGYDATRDAGSVVLDYTEDIGWQVSGLA